MSFVHLHTHSHYSLLSALPTIKTLIKAAKTDGMKALALTDAGNMYGAIEFYKDAKSEGIKPIIGIDAYMAARTRFDKEPNIDSKRTRLVLLAQNLSGYKNLLKLVTASHLEGFYYKPRLDYELIEQYQDGLIAIIPSFNSEVVLSLRNDDEKRATEVLQKYQDIFGAPNVFLELAIHPEIEGREAVENKIVTFSRANNVRLVAAHDVYYLEKSDRRARGLLLKIQTGNAPDDIQSGIDDSEGDFSFLTTKEAEERFKAVPDALLHTVQIADSIDLELSLGQWAFPTPNIESGRTPDEELRHIAYKGINDRKLESTPELIARLEYELSIIKQKGYAGYFIVVADLLAYAHKHSIFTNIRGSVAGSLVTYLTKITKVNPLEFKLPFERFLNPERPSAPDIDMDFADNRRDEVIEYVKHKYGEDRVAQIGTFGTMMARAAVRDIARAMGHPYGVGDTIAKLIPFGQQGFAMTIDRALSEEPDLKALYEKEPVAKEILDEAKKIEGLVRHISVHAAGVVIAPKPLVEYTPLQLDPKGGKIITQYDMYSIDENNVGLLKFDFLGIRNLSILADAVKRVQKIRGVSIDIETIPFDDPKTFAMLARGETIGLFQLNGSGVTRFLKELKPTTIHDINAMVALYRPGPIESIPEYIERKHNPNLITYLDPRLKDILDRSYGVITYQDDVLLVAITLAGYSWLQADTLRKAMGKKIPEVMAAEKEKLIKGFTEFGKLSKQKAEQLWKLIEPFAAYGFNKAHAASYGRVAYQTAYMKANYPLEYMAAVLTAESGDIDKVAEIITECKRMKIPVLPPDINESYGDFAVVPEKGAIRFGLYSIKNFGTGVSDSIIEERKARGSFVSITDFLKRIRDKNLNKKSLEALIKCGALDAFGERGSMYASIDDLLTFSRDTEANKHQDSLFSGLAIPEPGLTLRNADPAHLDEKLSWEKELLGLYVSGHPLDKHKEKLKRRGKTIEELKQELKEGITTVIGGIVNEIRTVVTKGGDKMAFVKIADYSGVIEVVVFPRLFTEHRELMKTEHCLAIKGRYSMRNGEPSLVAEAIKML